jgi:hypothetical protein
VVVGRAIFGGALLAPILALAQPPRARDPDWPCQQIKVAEMSPAAVWSGPEVNLQDTSWKNDPAVAALVETIARRREPIDQVEGLIHDFAQQAGDQRQPRLLQVFAGVFGVLDQERGSVMAGLDRFGARQKQLAADIRSDNETLRGLQADSAADPKAVQQMTQKVGWEVEVFQDRRQAISFACDIPGKIEQRLFSLAHQIQKELD